MSEDKMGELYPRWRMNEMALQAFVQLPDYKVQYEATVRDKTAPKVTTLVIPYAYATAMTISTYLLHVFCGRKPMFQVTSNKSETAESSQNMETVLQYNADHTKLIGSMWQFFLDTQCYGVGVMRTTWKNETAMRTLITTVPSN